MEDVAVVVVDDVDVGWRSDVEGFPASGIYRISCDSRPTIGLAPQFPSAYPLSAIMPPMTSREPKRRLLDSINFLSL
jgi:hypothetical protein